MAHADDGGDRVLRNPLGRGGVVFFDPGSAAALIFLTIILAGMSAGSIASHSSWPPAQFSYAILTMTPISLPYLAENNDLWAIGLMCLIYLSNVLAFARQLSRTLTESIRLRLEKQALVQQLREEMSAAEQARLRAVLFNWRHGGTSVEQRQDASS